MTDDRLFALDREPYMVPECSSISLCSGGKLMVGSNADSENWDIDPIDFPLDGGVDFNIF